MVEKVYQRINLDRGFRLTQLEPRTTAPKFGRHDSFEIDHMPAMVHDVLLHHKRIEAPWLPGQAERCKWVSEQDWLYEVDFDVDDPLAQSFLQFEGLDTVVEVYLNGKWLAIHANMFIPLRVEITGKLKNKNSLVLHFHSIFDEEGNPDHRILGQEVRRSAHSYDNYLGPNPYFSRMGVYGEIFLEITHGSEMNEVLVDAYLDDKLSEGTVQINASGTTAMRDLQIETKIFAPDGFLIDSMLTPMEVSQGAFDAEFKMILHQPQLWWPRGYGDQPLYQVKIILWVDGMTHQTQTRKIGFRRVEMPEMLHFTINNVPVRMWGSNWVVPHWHTAVWDHQRAEKLLDMAENANFNTLRVWAEVEAPHESFYEMADARGIMIWHDFASILQDTPRPKSSFSESRHASILAETEYWVKFLKHHPSIMLWCGGNEEPVWHSGEYVGEFIDIDPWPGKKAAEDVVSLCHELDPLRFALITSPWGGVDPNDPREGDTHGYTNIHYIPGYDYVNFASEDTRIAAPTLPSLKRFMAEGDIWPSGFSPMVTSSQDILFPQSWKKYTFMDSWAKTGPTELFYDAEDAESLVHQIGMAESYYYQQTIERQRRGRPADVAGNIRSCGGYLAWKFNDSWPQIYSGKVDYFLEPYHAYYALKRAFKPFLLSFEVGNYIWLWAINDTLDIQRGTICLQLFNPRLNRVQKEVLIDVDIAPGESRVVTRLDEVGLVTFSREHLVAAFFKDTAGEVQADALALMNIERRFPFPQAKLEVNIGKEGELIITTDRFARTIYLTGDADGEELNWFFADNYFDLLPGQTKTVKVLGKHKKGTITARPWYSSHATTVDWQIKR